MSSFKEDYSLVLKELQQAFEAVDENQILALVEELLKAEQVFVVGVGRVMLCLKAMAKRLNHLGIPTWYVGEINEPAITTRDLLIVGSGSGESIVPVAIARKAKELNARIAHIGSNPKSSLAPLTDIFVRIPVTTKLNLPDEIQSSQLMTNLFDQSLYILGDLISMEIVKRKDIKDKGGVWKHHANLE